MANLGLARSLLKLRFACVASSVITELLLVSLPAAAIVSTEPTGRQLVAILVCAYNSHTSLSGSANPYATALAVSMTEPPPTANMKSSPSRFPISIPL